MNEKYSGPKSFAARADLEPFVGHYRSDSPWSRSERVVLRKGRLWLNGAAPLEPIGAALFRPGSDSWNPDVVEFHEIANGKALFLSTNGSDRMRVDIP